MHQRSLGQLREDPFAWSGAATLPIRGHGRLSGSEIWIKPLAMGPRSRPIFVYVGFLCLQEPGTQAFVGAAAEPVRDVRSV